MSNDYNPWAEPQQPSSQPPSASPYAQSQSSASYPAQSQSSASYASEPTMNYGQSTGGSSAYTPATGYNGQQPAQPMVYGVERTAPGSANNLGALFDFGFKKFATRSLVKVAYIICFIVAIASWLLPVLYWFVFGAAIGAMSSGYGSSSSGGGVGILFGVLQLLFGWIAPLLFLITMRMLFEFFVLNQHQAESLEKLELK